jgi:hypothetical protein
MEDKLREWSANERKSGQKVADVWQEFFQAERKDAIDRTEEITETARVAEAKDKHEAGLLAMENVVGVAVGLKMTGAKPTKKWSLLALVEKKLAKSDVPKASLVPAELDGALTDVVEVGKVEPLLFNARVRPAMPGFSMGHFNITAGTFGCLVHDVRRCCCKLEKGCGCAPGVEECSGDYLILSNNHVLANVNAGKPGDLILQPGPFDGGIYPSDAVAALERFEPIVFGRAGYNLVDAAVARPLHSRNVIASIIGIVIPRGISQAVVGGLVIKAGRTTQVTVGRVLAINATINVGYGAPGVALYRHQIITTAMAMGGDSGSLLMDRGLNAVGLLFAGSPLVTIFNHIADVKFALGVRPVTS